MNFKSKLKIVWNNNGKPKRYIPRSLTGGTGWGVWDRKERRWVENREVKKMDAGNLEEGCVN